MSPLVAEGDPLASLITLWLPSFSLVVFKLVHPFDGMSGLPCSSSEVPSSSSELLSLGEVRSITSSESSHDSVPSVPSAGQWSISFSVGLADGKPGNCASHTAAPYVVAIASLRDGRPGLRDCPSISRLYSRPWSVEVTMSPAASITRHLTDTCLFQVCSLDSMQM